MSDRLNAHITSVCNTTSIHDCFEAFIAVLPEYGFTHAIFGHIVNPLMYGPEVTSGPLTNWDPAWLQEWVENHYIFHDPIALQVVRETQPFIWEDSFAQSSRMGRKILTAAKKYDLIFGVTIPIIRRRGPRGAVSVSTKTPPPHPHDWTDLARLAKAAFTHVDILRPTWPFDDKPRLTDREIEVLYLIAAGKTNWEAGMMLEISEHSVRDYSQSISRKLGTSNRAHSVARAIQLGVIIA